MSQETSQFSGKLGWLVNLAGSEEGGWRGRERSEKCLRGKISRTWGSEEEEASEMAPRFLAEATG